MCSSDLRGAHRGPGCGRRTSESFSALRRGELDYAQDASRTSRPMLDADKREIAIQWFIYGGSVLGVGLLIGLILPLIMPKRRRRDGWA